MDLLDFVHRRHPKAMVARVRRDGDVVVVSAARIAYVVGRDGSGAAALEEALAAALGAPVTLQLEEIRSPELEPVLVARHVWRTTQPVMVVDDDGNESLDPTVDVARVRQVAEIAAEQARRRGAAACSVVVKGGFGEVVVGDDVVGDDVAGDGAGDSAVVERAVVDEGAAVVEVAIVRARRQ